MGMKIVMTGASGFIGRHLLKRLEGRHEFSILSHRTAAPPVRGARVFKGDVLDSSSLEGLCEGADLALHLAYSFDANGEELFAVNVNGTANFVDECVRAGVRRFVLFSSAAVYGESKSAPTEDAVPMPETSYGIAKRMAEAEVEKRAVKSGIKTVVLRLTNVYGPGGRGVVNKYVSAISSGQPVILHGNGKQERDFVYVEDVINAVEKVIGYRPGESEILNIFNISGGSCISLLGLIALVEKVLEKKAEVRKEPERPGSVRRLWADISKARRVLGWAPKVGLEEGIRLTAMAKPAD